MLVRTVDTAPEQRNRYALNDADVIELSRYALIIEQHYGRAMDIEWGKDGSDGKLYILQARPETVKSQAEGKLEQRYRLTGDAAKNRCSPKAAPSARRSAPAGAADPLSRGDGSGAAGRRARHRHDRSRTGSR